MGGVTQVALPLIWFERPVLSALAPAVTARCAVLGPGTAHDRFAGVEAAVAAVAGSAPYDAAFLDRAPRLRVIARTGIGYDGVDVEAATARGVAVCNAPDGPTVSTAEHAITLMLMIAKRVGPSAAALRTGTSIGYFSRHDGIELDGKILGLIGFGRIARRVARIAAGIGMRIVVFDPFLPASAVPSRIRRADTLEALLRDADVVSVHVPLTAESRACSGRPRSPR